MANTTALLEHDDSFSGRWSLLLSSFLLHMLSLALPLTMMQVYDRILLNQSYSTLSWLVMGCSVAIILESILKYLRTRLGHLLAARFEFRSANKVLRHIIHSRLDVFEETSPSLHLERFQAIQILKSFYAGQVYQVMLDLPFAFLFLVVIYHLGGWVVAVPFICGTTYIIFVLYCRHQFDIQNTDETEAKQQRQGFLIQLLDSFPTVKGLNMEEQMLRRYERLQFKKVLASADSNSWAERPGLLGPTFSQVTMFGTIIFCSHRVISGDMTMGGLTACMMLSSRALQPLQQSASFWIKLPAVRQAKEQIQSIFDMESERTPDVSDVEPNDLRGEIDIKNLSFRYQEDAPWVLEDLSLHVPARSMVGLTGPSKNGSTTLLMLMKGLLRTEHGDVTFDGQSIDDFSEKTMRDKVQYLPRNGVLFKGTIIDNLTSFRPHRQDIALDIANMLGLDPLIASLSQGYETTVDSRSKISKDIVHRISLARCFITRPRILMVDKSTASMDSRSEQIFLELLDKLKSMCTIVIVTQWPYLLEQCESVYELKDGTMTPVKAMPARGEAVS